MKCFCDINMHKLDEHLSWYGYYGIGLTKETPLLYTNNLLT